MSNYAEKNVMGNDECANKIKELIDRHRQLDIEAEQLAEAPNFDQIKLQRIKKEKLALKDQIAQLSANQFPDIIA